MSENDVLFIHRPALDQGNGDAPPLSFDMIQNEAPTSHYDVLGESRRDVPIVLPPEHPAVYTTLRTNERNEGNTTWRHAGTCLYSTICEESADCTDCLCCYSIIQMVDVAPPIPD